MKKDKRPWQEDQFAHLVETMIEFRREAALAILRYELLKAAVARNIPRPQEG